MGGQPPGVLCADVLHGLIQHVLRQQLLHDGVRQRCKGPVCIALRLQPAAKKLTKSTVCLFNRQRLWRSLGVRRHALETASVLDDLIVLKLNKSMHQMESGKIRKLPWVLASRGCCCSKGCEGRGHLSLMRPMLASCLRPLLRAHPAIRLQRIQARSPPSMCLWRLVPSNCSSLQSYSAS